MQANHNAKESHKAIQSGETKAAKKQGISKEDMKFIGELGWLSAAAVLIAGVAANI